MGVEDVGEIAGELYGVPPSEFVALRQDQVTQAKAAGEKDLAAALSKLSRPTTSAWLVNLLVREAPAKVDELLDAGAALRDAQAKLTGEKLTGDKLRELSARRRAAVENLSAAARQLAANRGHPVSDSVEREVEQTLEAAFADREAADAVRSGRLTRALSYAGFGPVDVAGSVAAARSRAEEQIRPSTPAVRTATKSKPSGPRSGSAASRSGPADAHEPTADADRVRREEERARLERERQESLRAARQALVDAERRTADAQARRREHEAAARTAREQLETLGRTVEDLEAELERTRREHSAAIAAAKAAEQRLAESIRTADESERAKVRAKRLLDQFELAAASSALARPGSASRTA